MSDDVNIGATTRLDQFYERIEKPREGLAEQRRAKSEGLRDDVVKLRNATQRETKRAEAAKKAREAKAKQRAELRAARENGKGLTTNSAEDEEE